MGLDSPRTRREATRLGIVAMFTGLAGCGSTGGQTTERTAGAGGGGSGPGSEKGNGLGPLPEEYRTATALGGMTRSEESVSKKSTVGYQSEPNDGARCDECRYYIPDKNGDGLGACAVVGGKIEPQAWCVTYVEYER